MLTLAGTRAVVTGGSRGIGAGIALALARAGADVASIHLKDDYADETEAAIKELGRKTLFAEGNTGDADEVESFAQGVTEEFGGIDIWVNNAAKLFFGPFLEISDAEWRGVIDTNLNGYYNGCRAALRRMTGQQAGRIVNIASITARQPITTLTAYVTAKAGVLGLTRALGLEFGPQGITVNAVSPGAVETPMTSHSYTPEVRAAYASRIAVDRTARPEDIVGAVLFLSSVEAGYVTGHELIVDGGLHLNGDVGMDGDEDD